jgi:uncharacterized protein
MPQASARRRLTSTSLLLAALSLSGCQTYTAQTQGRDEAVRSGDLSTAVTRANQDASKHDDGKDALLYRLEQGAILRTAALANLPALPADPTLEAVAAQTQTNQALLAADHAALPARIAYYTQSIAALEDAARMIDEYEAAARVRVGAEAGALLTNQANVPYRGRGYDKVMLHTYQALNYLHLRDADAARVELNRALQRQRDAVLANAKRIEEAQGLAAEAQAGGVKDDEGRQGSSYDVERAKSDPRTSAGLARIEAKLDSAILPYGDYVNPFTTFLDALVFTHQAADASDMERARKSWERVVNFAPGNVYAQADYVAVEPDLQTSAALGSATSGPDATVEAAVPVAAAVPADTAVAAAELPAAPGAGAEQNLVYVIFETGAAPYRDQIRIDIPLFLLTGQISYVGAAFPELSPVGGHASSLTVSTSQGTSLPSARIATMDSVLAQDFKNEWPSILTKTLISTATKATIDAVLQKQIQDQAGATGALLFKLATAATQAAINIADTRTWRSLPKEFHYVRLPAPADGVLSLRTSSGQSASVQLEPAAVGVVYVKSTSASSPLLIGQFTLKK